MICDNCDIRTANWQCLTCPSNLSRLCEDCLSLHKRTKSFRNHKLEPLPQPKVAQICRNCDQNPSKFECTSCGVEDKYLCMGCSVMHGKIKQFRGHRVIPLETSSSDAISVVSSDEEPHFLMNFCIRMLEDHVERSLQPRWTTDWLLSFSFISILCIIYFVLTKRFCGPFQPVVHFLILVALIRRALPSSPEKEKATESDSTPYTSPLTNINIASAFGQQKKTGLPLSSLSEWAREFPDEFSYQSKPATSAPPVLGKGLRPRTRPYQPRSLRSPKPPS